MNTFPLSKTEYGIYAEQMSAGNTAYNIAISVTLPDDVDLERFQDALRAVIAAHPYLKTGFCTDENGEVRKFIREGEIEICLARIDAFRASDWIRPFDLMNEFLFRPAILITPEKTLFYFEVHHSIFDGESVDLFLDQIDAAYRGAAPEPETFTANDFAAEETERTASPAYEEARAYYRERFDGIDTDSALFTDKNERPHAAKEISYAFRLAGGEKIRAREDSAQSGYQEEHGVQCGFRDPFGKAHGK